MGTGSSAAVSRPVSGRNPNQPQPSSSRARPPVKQQDSQVPKDLMISYSHADKEMMLKIKEKLEENGITVWVDVVGLNAGVDFLSKIGQAIIDAKLFISLLSKTCVKSKYCQDELALAYVSDTAIFPVTLVPADDLYPLMDTGMKLQLARYQWMSLCEGDSFDAVMTELISMMKDVLSEKTTQENSEKQDKSKVLSPESNQTPNKNVVNQKTNLEQKPKLLRQETRVNLNRQKGKNVKIQIKEDMEKLMPEDYWKQYYISDRVDWNKFVDNFITLFKRHLEKTFTKEDQEWLISILRREMEVDDENMLDKEMFIAFCTVDGEEFPLWERVQEQARESYAMKEVFDMESSVRVEAIENLGRFRSLAVVDALRDLLSDPDANVRSVAAISLARTEASDSRTIKQLMKCLNDKDRLVREAGCLALGHLQAESAVKRLLHMWRNDVISHVREAASVALQQIGGEEVNKAMHVTSVLAEEIRKLTAE